MPRIDIYEDSPSITIEYRESAGGPVETLRIERTGQEIDWPECRVGGHKGVNQRIERGNRGRNGIRIELPEKS